ncbi:MAG TPA: IPT/TIG domain-containing protein [Vicinamibacterales bacterium]|jgi:sugar lactone lactonase YvrE|nr:IPT/TIG domain-containing protein [Vicinamibacterales bacterium]
MNHSRITAVQPRRAVAGGRIGIHGSGFPVDAPTLPEVRIGDRIARIVFASSTRLDVIVPHDLPQSGSFTITLDGERHDGAIVDVAVALATDLHQVDNPVCDRDGNVYVTYSGKRGQAAPVSVFRVTPDGTREAFSQGIVNATSMALDPAGRLYVSSRFDGVVYRLDPDGSPRPFAADLGIACGLAFAADGTLFVGDRSGTIFKIDQVGRTTAFATLPASVAAFHLAIGSDGGLYVTGPTLSSCDAVYRIDPSGTASVISRAFGRPQGLAFDPGGSLLVVEALAGSSGVYRVERDREPELVIAGSGLVGLAFDRQGSAVVCSAESVYRLRPAVG